MNTEAGLCSMVLNNSGPEKQKAYEDSFRSRRLGNWEVEKWYPERRPRARRGRTRIIADDRGHLLPGVPRRAPWGHFTSTWQMPRRITRKLAKELSSACSADKKSTEQSSWEKRSSHHPLIEQETSASRLPPTTDTNRKQSGAKREIPIVEEKSIQHPELVEDEHDYTNPVGHERNPKVLSTADSLKESLQVYNHAHKASHEKKNLLEKLVDEERRSVKSDISARSKDSGRGESIKSLERFPATDSQRSPPKVSPIGSRISSSSINKEQFDFVSSEYARKLAQNNLKHRPLPDRLEEELLKSLKLEGATRQELERLHTAPAIGHRKYVSPGPTQCSKVRVYRRPKRSSPTEQGDLKSERGQDPKEIDLALRWELVPEDEPRRPAHIDGSNGSAAPGIFTVVRRSDSPATDSKRPASAWPAVREESKPLNPSAVMDIINNNTDDINKKVTERDPRDIKNHRDSKNQVARNDNNSKQRPGSRNSSECGPKKNSSLNTSVNSEKLQRDKHSPRARSSPNLSTKGDERGASMRACAACDSKDQGDLRTAKPEYKMAFKAGVPNSRNNSGSDSSTRSNNAKNLHVPKPKTPFAKRSYSINTLAPPFSLWPGTTGMDYPEHWRLTSVYQQSYKPLELRKNPCIKGIFR